VKIDSIYEESVKWGMDRARKLSTIALGFHSVIDGMIRIDPQKIEKELPLMKVPATLDEIPTSIETKEDFFRGLLFSFVNGKALQIMIDSEDVYEWIMKKFGSGTLRLGGTSANMAKTLSHFPFPKILIYAYPLTKELVNLFPKSENLFIVHNNTLSHPQDIQVENGIKAIHWIFEFSEGQGMKIGKEIYTCPRSNRFIASWNPVNSRLEIREPFRSYALEHANEISKFLVSGFHIMRDNYSNGETAEDRMLEMKSFIEQMKKNNPQIQFHLEFASIRRDGVRKAVENVLFSNSDSLGVNEVELAWIAHDMGMDANGIENGDVKKISRILSKLRGIGLKRIHFHTLGFYLLAFDENYYHLEKEKKALAFAALAAAQRARDGYLDVGKIKELLEIPNSNMEYREWKVDNTIFVLFPTKVVKNQKISVGLGDTISSLGFTLG
jgi:ADP-dependent phosphofructokinase/glucokinase